jgi:hypothetical protein
MDVADAPDKIWYSHALPFVTAQEDQLPCVALMSPATATANRASPELLGVTLGVFTVLPLVDDP